MDDSLVRTEHVEGGVAVLTLADAAHRNALTLEMTRDLAAAVGAALDARRPGAGARRRAAGVLRRRLGRRPARRRSADLPEMYAGFLALADAPVVTVAAVDGAAIGAGVNLPFACDVVVASPAARFDPRFLDLGLHPGGGQLWRLERRVGRQAAAALVALRRHARRRRGRGQGPGVAVRRRATSSSTPPLGPGPPGRVAAGAGDGPGQGDPRRHARGSPTAAEAVALELEAQRWSMEQPEFRQRVEALKAALDQPRER